jgi:hypothetical protein
MSIRYFPPVSVKLFYSQIRLSTSVFSRNTIAAARAKPYALDCYGSSELFIAANRRIK